MSQLVELLAEVLPKDKSSAVTQTYISDALGVSKRTVRQLVQQARHEGICVCSTPYDGYWLSSKSEDIEETVAILNAHVNTLIDTIADMKKMEAKICGD